MNSTPNIKASSTKRAKTFTVQSYSDMSFVVNLIVSFLVCLIVTYLCWSRIA